MNKHSSSVLALLAACVSFVVWIALVGNPHVVETVIGMVLAWLVYRNVCRWLQQGD